jgi:hypothetical protein
MLLRKYLQAISWYGIFVCFAEKICLDMLLPAEIINDGNSGDCTARSSLDPIGIEIFQYDYSRLLHLNHLKFSKNAISCYARILVNLASIISRSYGLHSNTTTIKQGRWESPTAILKIVKMIPCMAPAKETSYSPDLELLQQYLLSHLWQNCIWYYILTTSVW